MILQYETILLLCAKRRLTISGMLRSQHISMQTWKKVRLGQPVTGLVVWKFVQALGVDAEEIIEKKYR